MVVGVRTLVGFATMTLRRERGDTIVSDDEGWSVRVLGRTGLEYRVGDRTMRIDSEILAAPHGAAIYTSSMRESRTPHEDERLTETDRRRIVEHVRRAFAAWGYEIDVY